ncbi:DUF58 domain-containing protein [Halorientalis persicus]|uniref:DUF58 domain-containing protein n=1 Tax=Halorientalis persicus TaxID=1367881 RepID=UPI00147E624A|nr:DUF58 domain-containing protein [Halorientalis persicus]
MTTGDFTTETVRDQVAVDEPVLVRLRVTLPSALPFDLTVVPELPLGVDGPQSARSLTLPAGEQTAETTFEVSSSVAGEASVGPAIATGKDPGGFFTATVRGTDTATIKIRPRTPTNLHVGEGGDPVTSLYGEHRSDTAGAGLEPYEVREYAPGDQLSRMDWKATARLNHPHIREFELTTSHETLLVVDHRTSMSAGREGETELDYLREVALAFVDIADRFDDPLGLYTVGNEGVTTTRDPAAGVEQYGPVRQIVRGLSPVSDSFGSRDLHDGAAVSRGARSADLSGDDSPLAKTLRPYFEGSDGYVRRLRDQPLFQTVQLARRQLGSGAWTVILTDDSNPTELRESVRFARQNSGQVLVFLASSVLYEGGELADVQDAYEQYVSFEEFRQSLASLDRVSAFEVAPSDRLAAVVGRHAGEGSLPERGRTTAGRSRPRSRSGNWQDSDRPDVLEDYPESIEGYRSTSDDSKRGQTDE